jgi:hypothetical protein
MNIENYMRALAVAYFHADLDNQARILAAFPELFERYRRMDQDTTGT